MSQQAVAPVRQSAASEPGAKNEVKLLRNCECGQHTLGGAECSGCKANRMTLQRWPVDRALPENLLGTDQTRGSITSDSPHVSDLARLPVHSAGLASASQTAAPVVPVATAVSSPAGPPAGRGARSTTVNDADAGERAEPAETEIEEAVVDPLPQRFFLVDDGVDEPRPGQMARQEFLARLQEDVTRVAEDELAPAGHTTDACPYLRYWFAYYRRQSSRHIERALRRYAPEPAGVKRAADYIPLVAARVRRAAATWVRTGAVTGVPAGLPTGYGRPEVTEPAASRNGSIFEPVLLKAREGGAHRDGEDPAAIRAELGRGRPLDGGVRSRMESAFGRSIGPVRLHTDGVAHRLAGRLNARAFTIGSDVAFGSGQYRPGTLLGDALIAHELVHVIQQRSATGDAVPATAVGAGYDALEADADAAAVGAVTSLWDVEADPVSDAQPDARPRMTSGLRLQRCGVFGEWSAEKYQGYDASTKPAGLVVPVNGKRKVKLRKRPANMTIESSKERVVTVDATQPAGGMTVEGLKHDRTRIVAREGAKVVDQLDVSVKAKITKGVDYHYVSDSAGHSTRRRPGDERALNDKLNEIWERQANIHFEIGVVDSRQVPTDLGRTVIAGRATDPAARALSVLRTSNNYQVFLVWEFETESTGGQDVTQGGTLGSMTILEDQTGSDLAFPHEAGHYLGLVTRNEDHPNSGIMANIRGGISPRVFKQDADKVNP